jgi:hypothetical protein
MVWLFLASLACALLFGHLLLQEQLVPKLPPLNPPPPRLENWDPYYKLPKDHPDHPDNWGPMQWYDVGR